MIKNFFKRFFGGNNKGFTFLEVIVAVFIFALVMVAVVQIFSNGYLGFKKTQLTQKNLETAQQVMNIIAKTLRTSVVISPTTPGEINSIVVFDYSRTDRKNCIRYTFSESESEKVLKTALTEIPEGEADPVSYCSGHQPSDNSAQNMTVGQVKGKFYVSPTDLNSTPKEVGKIVIAMRVCLKDSCETTSNPKDEAIIQTTVSLRNYKEAD